jgi:hypothetical protein
MVHATVAIRARGSGSGQPVAGAEGYPNPSDFGWRLRRNPRNFLAIAKAPRWSTERAPRARSEASIKAARATWNRQRSGYRETPISEFPTIFQAPEQIAEARGKLHNVLI